mmetsp:Transcript_40820/g.73098  ORF Transcript_40820/g.73098 Transcript_40820/m.73098 type:complete len:85 (+) Transcript_40820:748-1002(+)
MSSSVMVGLKALTYITNVQWQLGTTTGPIRAGNVSILPFVLAVTGYAPLSNTIPLGTQISTMPGIVTGASSPPEGQGQPMVPSG